MKLSVTIDSEEALKKLSQALSETRVSAAVFLDINCGMNRTGIAPGNPAKALYAKIAETDSVSVGGLHVYDGHITMSDPTDRKLKWTECMKPVWEFQKELKSKFSVPTVVGGGSPTFPFFAETANVECSPGTTVFWDAGYSSKFPDLPFLPAALVLTRVVSNPSPGRYCLDLGHKAIASENPHPRVLFLEEAELLPVMHSEEHLVVETKKALEPGRTLFGIPWHICPTVALHAEASVIQNHRVAETWKISARDRKIRT